MEARISNPDDAEERFIAALPAHVVAALDHLTPGERVGVRMAVDAFTHHAQDGKPIPGDDPLYLLWAAPEVRLIVRRVTSNAPVEVEDIVRPATLRTFAEAYGG